MDNVLTTILNIAGNTAVLFILFAIVLVIVYAVYRTFKLVSELFSESKGFVKLIGWAFCAPFIICIAITAIAFVGVAAIDVIEGLMFYVG